MSEEEIIMGLVVKGGDARGKAMMAIRAAKQRDFARAEELLRECNQALIEAHAIQTGLIQEDLNGTEKREMDMLLVHGQDHLMDAMVVRDLATEMIDMFRIVVEGK